MLIKPLTKDALQVFIGNNIRVGLSNKEEYEGEVIRVTKTTLSLLWFSVVKDELRELDIPLGNISWIKVDE